MRKTLMMRLLAAGLFCLSINTVGAKELTGTLKKVKETGTLVLGVRDASIPFSFLDEQQQYIGYHIDLCMKIVQATAKLLGIPVKAKLQPVASATRIPLMANGTIDLECGNTTNNSERQQHVWFSPTTFITATRLMSKKNANIRSLTDLRGKTISSTSGSSNLKLMVSMNNTKNLGMTVIPVVDHGTGMAMLESDRITAYATDDIILYSLAANSKNPADYVISKEALSVEPYGIMLRKDDSDFKKVVDQAITEVFRSGQIQPLYAKWFQSPLPPKGINLNVPLSEKLKTIFAHPTDSGDPTSYL
ncbi:MAG: amino acid ABC transporter substrate-binding protein [Burkholderiaceae bacterium]|nr:amino acid ABC transporter substrate-binding protein [Burkholderiaceae bacterium]